VADHRQDALVCGVSRTYENAKMYAHARYFLRQLQAQW